MLIVFWDRNILAEEPATEAGFQTAEAAVRGARIWGYGPVAHGHQTSCSRFTRNTGYSYLY